MLSKTQSHSEFFIAQIRIVGREVLGKIPLVVAGPPTNGTFKQPFTDTIFRATTHLADLTQQW